MEAYVNKDLSWKDIREKRAGDRVVEVGRSA